MNSFDGLCEILVKDYQQTAELLRPDTPFADLAIDSLGVIELIFAIEDKFKVVATDADPEMAKHFATLQDITDYIDRMIAARDAPDPATANMDSLARSTPQ